MSGELSSEDLARSTLEEVDNCVDYEMGAAFATKATAHAVLALLEEIRVRHVERVAVLDVIDALVQECRSDLGSTAAARWAHRSLSALDRAGYEVVRKSQR